MNLKELLENKIYSAPLSNLDLSKKCVINTINPHSYCEAKKDEIFEKALIAGDILLPDGSGIILAAKIILNKTIKKIAGADIHQFLLEKANQKKYKVFYLGASKTTLDLIKKRVSKEYSNILIETYSPPFKKVFSKEDNDQMIHFINQFNPDILFVGMTAPKQEKWVFSNKNEISAKVIVSIGAVFDFYAGTVKRSSPFWINIGLEWLPRLIREPKRLWKRNFISTPKFLFEIFRARCF